MAFSYDTRPQEWLFSEDERKKYESRAWWLPVRLVREGHWAALWRADATTRGGGVTSALLPVLALHAWPGKHSTLGVRNTIDADSARWTGWEYQSQRKLAMLAGVSLESVGVAMTRLEEMGLLERRRMAPPRHQGGPPRVDYRLSATLYPTDGERFVILPAALFYGGLWRMLPNHSDRQLYLTVAGLDKVVDVEALAAHLEHEFPEVEDAADRVIAYRRKHPLSYRDLMDASGMEESAVQRALELLRYPIFTPTGAARPSIPLVYSGEANRKGMHWFGLHPRGMGWTFNTEYLNDRRKREALQREKWPQLDRRRQEAAARKRQRENRAAERRRAEAAKKSAATRAANRAFGAQLRIVRDAS